MAKISAKLKENACLRILAGKATVVDEARRLGVTRQTVHEWVREYKAAHPEAVAAPEETPAPPPQQAPAAEAKTPEVLQGEELERARRAAGVGPEPAKVADAVAAAGVDDARFCLETIGHLKSAGVYVFAQVSGVPGTEPTLAKIAPLSEMTKGVIASNATWLAPILRRQSGPEMLYAFLGIEAILAFLAVRGIAAKYKPREEEAPTAAAAEPAA